MSNMYICIAHYLPMRSVPGYDACKCTAGCYITGVDIVTGAGKDAYWTTAKDLGNSGASYSSNQSGILTSTTGNTSGNSNYTGLGSFVNTSNTNWIRFATAASTTIGSTTSFSKIVSYSDLIPGPKPRLPVEKRDDPIHAWRFSSKLKIVNDVVLFDAVYPLNGCYAADDRAICSRSRYHHWTMIPVEECACGFYASKPGAVLDRSCFDEGYDSDDDIPDVLLEVELYGRVIEANAGYRAQHQKILAVYSDVDYGVVPGFNIRPTSEAYAKMRKEVEEEMKIRFSDGSKNIDIEMDEDNSFIYDSEGFTVGLGDIQETTEEDE